MQRKTLFSAALFVTIAMNSAFAEVDIMKQMVPAHEHIQDLDKAVNQAKKDSDINVQFPAFIPKTKTDKKYFASLDETSKQNGFSYIINVDSTPDCHGVKYCNVGQFSGRKDAKPEMMTDKHKKKITTIVDLADGTKAYFTPGHAMGDFFPASIQWLDNKVLYMISWTNEAKTPEVLRASLITMANSAKHPGSD